MNYYETEAACWKETKRGLRAATHWILLATISSSATFGITTLLLFLQQKNIREYAKDGFYFFCRMGTLCRDLSWRATALF